MGYATTLQPWRAEEREAKSLGRTSWSACARRREDRVSQRKSRVWAWVI